MNALIETTKGNIDCELFNELAPKTVANFSGLARGSIEWKDQNGEMKKEPFYDNIIFHRVIKDFMIQSGCPLGTGTGGPGYQFEDECFRVNGKLTGEIKELIHPVEYGTLCMANSGPDTNGSQFFIVTKKDGCAWLNGKHTVFGKVTSGMEVVHEIENAPTAAQDKPAEDISIKKITITD